MKRKEKMSRTIWWNYRYNEAQKILQGDSCYIKEKWGRVDTTYWGDRPGVQDRLYKEVERPSESHCQYCNRGGTQYRMDTGWAIHLCRRCALMHKIHFTFKRIKRWISGNLKSLKDLITHHTD